MLIGINGNHTIKRTAAATLVSTRACGTLEPTRNTEIHSPATMKAYWKVRCPRPLTAKLAAMITIAAAQITGAGNFNRVLSVFFNFASTNGARIMGEIAASPNCKNRMLLEATKT